MRDRDGARASGRTTTARGERVAAPLVAVFVLAVASAGAIGLSNAAGGADRVRAEALSGAEALARDLTNELDALVRALGADPPPPWAVRWRADALGGLVEPAVGPVRRGDGDASELIAGLTREVDALDRSGQVAAADRRLTEIAARDDRPHLAAWALSWLAARADDPDTERAHLDRIVASFAAVRDERGLAFGLAARARRLALDGDPLDALEALHLDLLADRRSLDDAATTALAERVAERVLARDPTRAAALADARDASDRPLALFAEWSRGASNWIATGAPGGAWFDAATGEDRRAPARVLAIRRASDAVPAVNGGAAAEGAAIELERLVARALEGAGAARWRELGYGAEVLGPEGASIVALDASVAATMTASVSATEPRPDADAPAALGRPAPPLSMLTPRVVALDVERRVAAERRRFAVTALAFGGALVVAAFAGLTVVRSVRRQARTTREREAFVAAVTHELKSPVASIRLLAELLESGDVEPERAREFARRTVAESERLGRLVDSVLRFAGRGADAPTEPVDLAGAIDSAVASVAPVAAERGFEVRVDARALDAAARPAFVRADRDGLVGALAELVDNATKYGDPAAGVEVVARRVGDRARVEVLDRGPGVPEGERERVFEPFRRLGDELTREARGVGLGLALVQRTVEAAGGRVGCDGRQGGGARLWLELPLDQQSDGADANDRPDLAR